MPTNQENSTLAVPDAVLAYSQDQAIGDDLERALEIVRDTFPDLVQVEIGLETHEVLARVIRIDGRVPGSPAAVAQRVWDCVGRWAAILPPGALMYLHLSIHPEGE